MGIGSFLGVNSPERDADRPPLSSAEVASGLGLDLCACISMSRDYCHPNDWCKLNLCVWST